MKAKFTQRMNSISVLVLVSLLVGALALAFPVGTVAAASPAQDTQPPAGENMPPDPARLEKAYQRELNVLEGQANRLERSGELVGKAEARIAELQANGKDTTALEEALAGFEEQLAQAQASHDEAAAILSTHAGFDGDGKVTDAVAAKETVKEAGQALKDAARTLRFSVRDLLRALREFRRDNR